MIQRNKTVDAKEYEDLTHKQKNILHAASGCDKSNTEIAREVEASLSYVAEVLNNYDHMLPLSETPEIKDDEEKNYSDLTTTQQYILDLRSEGSMPKELIADQVGCSESYVYKTINNFENLVPTPGYDSNESGDKVAADGGVEKADSNSQNKDKNNSSFVVIVNCDCGESHEVTVK